jgi:hypothetical protein
MFPISITYIGMPLARRYKKVDKNPLVLIIQRSSYKGMDMVNLNRQYLVQLLLLFFICGNRNKEI